MVHKMLLRTAVVFLAFSAMLTAQTLDELLQKNYAARGGLDKIKAVKTLKLKGTMMMQGMEMEMQIMIKRPNKVRSEMTMQGQSIITATDGEKGWMVNPMAGSTEPQEIPKEQLKKTKDQSNIEGTLVTYKEDGTTLKLLGKEKLEGSDVFHIEATTKDSVVRHIYLDVKSCLETMMKTTVSAQGQTMDVFTIQSNFKTVAGVKFAHTTEAKVNGETAAKTEFKKIEVNVPIPDSIFVMPAK